MDSEKRINKSLTIRYAVALSLIATLVTASYITLKISISKQESTAAIVNVSGRQRMLSQRIALFSQALVLARTQEKRSFAHDQLSAAVELMELSHRGLTRGSDELGLPATMSAVVQRQYFEPPDAVDLTVHNYLKNARTLLQTSNPQIEQDHPALIEVLEIGPGRLLGALDRLVKQYQIEGEASVARIAMIEMMVWLMALSLLVLEVLFIFRPMVRHVVHYVGAIRTSEARFQAIVNSTSNAVILAVDHEGLIVAWNTAAEKSFGYSEEKILGHPLTQLMPERFREKHIEGYRRVIEGKPADFGSEPREAVALHADGHEFPIEISLGSWSDGGQVFVSGIVHDITERKLAAKRLYESEERFRTTLKGSPVVVFGQDRDLKYTWVFNQDESYSAESVIGKGDEEILPPDMADELVEFKRGVLESGKSGRREFNFEFSPGNRMAYDLFCEPHLDASGNIIGINGASTDISELKALESQLLHAQKMEAIGQLTGGIAHDFNNLLQVILNNIELAKQDVGENEHLLERLDSAMVAGQRGGALTQQLLSFSRKQTLHPKSTDPCKLVQEMLKLLGRTLGENIEIDTDLDESVRRINVDQNGLESALLNLSINARAAMPGGGKLTISVKSRMLAEILTAGSVSVPPGDYVEISVRDIGSGMSAETLSHVFEPFFTTKAVGEGSGLGLSMVFGYVRQSGGYLLLDSEIDKGTTVTIILPVSEDVETAVGERLQTEAAIAGEGVVLVVEDDSILLRTTVASIRSIGYEPVFARDAGSALKVLAENRNVDLLFTDVVMPGGMNGMQLADEALRRNGSLKVLLTSGYPNHELARMNKRTIPFELIKKPYTKDELAAKLKDALEK